MLWTNILDFPYLCWTLDNVPPITIVLCQGAFLLYHLATNTDKQEKLYQELRDVLGPQGKITEASYPKLKYLKVEK